jgi:hypothetical protein
MIVSNQQTKQRKGQLAHIILLRIVIAAALPLAKAYVERH